MQIDLLEQQIVKKKRSRSNKDNGDSIPAFLLKTYEIIDNPQNHDIIGWNEEGTAFIVKKVNEFSDIILPKSFKHSNFASFVRQLNMYDFHKTRHDNNENEFKHKLFQRGKKHLLSQIKRKTNDVKEQNSLSLIKNEQVRTGQSEIPEILMQMGKLSNKQQELEKLMKILIKQNEKIMKENKYLWSELTKNKHKNENSEEQIMKWVLQSLQGTKQNNKHKTNFQTNNLLMLKQTSENDDEVQLEAQNQRNFETDKFQFDQLPSQIISQNLEQQIEKLSKNQIIQVLMSAITNNQKQEKKNTMKFEDDISFDDEYPVMKKIDLKQDNQDRRQENQLMVYSEPYFFHKLEDNYIISESPNPSRKNSYYDQDPIPQFLESEL
ncbi:unnamed protein product (macronuclear) [Paramecium tetraurelia]|uniref:HSF-type DNA-binding domain-containing protein n=1 Tax=Paramecium tetraurelia TaxID=5888 RepID=A0EEY8_PARTE|nr:uncharacterized protein GSPATT00026202001 [Paramecium tetraurelia]CAK93879.1 unnamed protein product [Paramecium tetraurelia]|eukprot:XP_001461252.1 hypothetical protein (macronuclear) [Paramecium tetraurelia strain d4-2]